MCLAVKCLSTVGLESLLDGADLVDRLVARRLSKRPIPGHPLELDALRHVARPQYGPFRQMRYDGNKTLENT